MKLKKKKLLLRPVPFTRLIPNMVTLIGLIVGVSSIRYALDSAWEKSVYCILIATILDGLDGRFARLLNATSHFGAELDSICDFVNFGLCPPLIIYLWAFQQYEYNVISWASIMFFIVCMSIRLARFNTAVIKTENDQKSDLRFFMGVPAPSGAILALIPVILDFEISTLISNFDVRSHALCINLYIVVIATLLAGRFPTPSIKNIHIKPEYLSLFLIISAVIIILTIIYPWYILPLAAIIYIMSIPVCIHYTRKCQVN